MGWNTFTRLLAQLFDTVILQKEGAELWRASGLVDRIIPYCVPLADQLWVNWKNGNAHVQVSQVSQVIAFLHGLLFWFQIVENYAFKMTMLNIFSLTSIIEIGHTACQFKD